MSDKTHSHPIPPAFAELGLRPSLLRALADAQFTKPSEIQSMLIPLAIKGIDILGQARTGTGKTAAFALPIMHRAVRGIASQALVLVPTRELAVQVDAEFKMLGKHTPIRCVPLYGGQRITAQEKILKHGPEVLVATPGRCIDLHERRIINFSNLRMAILDEVDRMFDIGFRDDIRKILSQVAAARKGNPDTFDEDGRKVPHDDKPFQTIFVSATISDEIEKLARQFMHEPIEKLIAPGANDRPTVEKVEQYFVSVQPWDKYRLLKSLLDRENPKLAIIFCRTKFGAQKLAKKLHADGIECREIHGNLHQNKRDRVMKSFRSGKFDVLVATDLASRGIDVAEISHIINFDVPDDPEAYVHRVGRTARMGAAGRAFTFITADQGEELTKIEMLINMMIPQTNVEGFAPTRAPRGDDAPKAQSAAGNGNGQGPAVRSDKPIVELPPTPRTLGGKIPLSRRHKRRR